MAGLVGVSRREDRGGRMPSGGPEEGDQGGTGCRDRGRRTSGDRGMGLSGLPSDHALLHMHAPVGVNAPQRAQGCHMARP